MEIFNSLLKNPIWAAKCFFRLRLRQTHKKSSTGLYRPASGLFARLSRLTRKNHFSPSKRVFQETVRRFFRPSNSLIFLFDAVAPGLWEQVETTLTETEKYYRAVTLSELVSRLEAGNPAGNMVLAFRYPRKRLILEILPRLLARQTPFTVFVDTECVGVNRLPLAEEIRAYHEAYGALATGTTLKAMLEQSHASPGLGHRIIEEYRATKGIFPVEKMDPLSYFSTWGELLRVPETLRDLGLHLSFRLNSENEQLWAQQVSFFEHQTRSTARHILWEHTSVPPDGVTANSVVVAKHGAVTNKSNPLFLPVWNVAKEG